MFGDEPKYKNQHNKPCHNNDIKLVPGFNERGQVALRLAHGLLPAR